MNGFRDLVNRCGRLGAGCLFLMATTACAKLQSDASDMGGKQVEGPPAQIEDKSSALLSCMSPPGLPDNDPFSACGPGNLSSNGCMSALPNWWAGFWNGTAMVEQNTVAMSIVNDSTLQSSVLDVNFIGGWAATRHSHTSGVFVLFAPPPGDTVWPAGSVIRVEFDARTLSGSPYLQIQRPWGGLIGGPLTSTLTSSWQHFSLTVKLAYSSGGLVFSPVPAVSNDLQTIVPGHFQLDNFVVSGTLPAVNPNPCDATNMFSNGCFASTTTALERRVWTGSTFIQDPIEVASEPADAPSGSAPSLRVRFRSDIPATHSHVSGLYTVVAPPGGPYPDVNSALRVEFDAKRISGSRYLQLTRQWGGGGAGTPVTLNDTWTHHVVTVRTSHSLDGFLLALVPTTSADLQLVQPGEFLIDNFVVKPAPSVLVIHQDHQIDPPVPKSLEAKGLVIDAVRAAELPGVSAATLSKYNVLWIEALPAADDPGLSLSAFQQLLATHMAAGGGVFVSPSQLRTGGYRNTHDWLRTHGAGLPLETLDLTSSVSKRRAIRMSANFFLTNSLASETELVAGASQVWFPEPFYNGGPHATTTAPVLHDARWLPVLKAGKGVQTSPTDMVGWPAYDESWAAGIQQRCGARDPTLLAVRDVGPGRLGVFRMLWSYHLSAGRSWAQNGILLEKGFDTIPSDFERLLANTLHWLAEPTWRSRARGGAVVPPDRFDPPLLKPGAAAPHVAETLQPVPTQPEYPVYRGVIGAQTLAQGSSTVDQYIAAAQTAGHQIQFIVFLEDYAAVGPNAISALATECLDKSTSSLQLFAGYRISTNIGGQYFIYGRSPPPVPAELIANGTLILEDADASGFLNSSRVQNYFYDDVRKNGDINTSGMFNLNSATSSLRLPFLKFMSAAGVKVYDSQLAQTEDHYQDYLLTNSGVSPLTPLAIHQITRHEKLAELLTRHDNPSDPARPYLTYASASSVPNLFSQALRWSDFFFAPTVSVSNGPKVRLWPTIQRRWTFGTEDFVAQRNGALIPLRVSSSSGVDRIELYDGIDLVGSIKAGGRTDVNLELPMSTHLAQYISAVVTDTTGAKAISFPYASLKDGSPTPAYCADHVNDCGGMRLARGSFWPGPAVLPVKQEIGEGWDGAVTGTLPPVNPGQFSPVIFSGTVTPFSPYQIPRLELADERAYRGGADVLYSVPYGFGFPWQSWGPVSLANQMSGTVRVTEFQQYTKRVLGTYRHGGLLGGTRAALYDESITLGPQGQITNFGYTLDWRTGALPLDVRFAIGNDATILSEGRVSSALTNGGCGTSDGCSEFSGSLVETGNWMAAYSTEQPGSANAWLLVNRGPAFRVNLLKAQFSLHPATLASPGTLGLNLLSVGWEVENPINGLGPAASRDALIRHVQYLKDHGNVTMLKPTSYNTSTLGLVAVQAPPADGYVEMTAPRSASNVDVSLPVAVSGLQPRWSVWLLQKQGYNGAQYYGGTTDRVRPLGVVRTGNAAGTAYFSLYTSQADHHVLAGHPVIADNGSQLFITAVAASADAQGKPTSWYVAVNNPTGAPISTTLRAGIPNLPGFSFAPKAVTLQPGQLIFRNTAGAWTDAVAGTQIP